MWVTCQFVVVQSLNPRPRHFTERSNTELIDTLVSYTLAYFMQGDIRIQPRNTFVSRESVVLFHNVCDHLRVRVTSFWHFFTVYGVQNFTFR